MDRTYIPNIKAPWYDRNPTFTKLYKTLSITSGNNGNVSLLAPSANKKAILRLSHLAMNCGGGTTTATDVRVGIESASGSPNISTAFFYWSKSAFDESDDLHNFVPCPVTAYLENGDALWLNGYVQTVASTFDIKLLGSYTIFDA